jgi:hypothetical protein
MFSIIGLCVGSSSRPENFKIFNFNFFLGANGIVGFGVFNLFS